MKSIVTPSVALSLLLLFSCNSDPAGHAPTVGDLVNRVSQERLENLVSELSGAVPATIGGSSYTIATRATGSGIPIMNATQYAYELLASFGLSVEFQNWSTGEYNCRNVAATRTGTVRQDEVVIICANIDCLPSGGPAPGADCNASGSAGVLECARIVSGQKFERTVRFVLFTGSEQGFLGSSAYVSGMDPSETVVAVYYLKMIGWDVLGGPVMLLHTREATNPGYDGDLVLAQALSDSVDDYSTALTPVVVADHFSQGDHVSFWNQGIAAVCVIEDHEDDLNAYFHTDGDTVDRLNMAYLTNIVRTVLGTASEAAVLP